MVTREAYSNFHSNKVILPGDHPPTPEEKFRDIYGDSIIKSLNKHPVIGSWISSAKTEQQRQALLDIANGVELTIIDKVREKKDGKPPVTRRSGSGADPDEGQEYNPHVISLSAELKAHGVHIDIKKIEEETDGYVNTWMRAHSSDQTFCLLFGLQPVPTS